MIYIAMSLIITTAIFVYGWIQTTEIKSFTELQVSERQYPEIKPIELSKEELQEIEKENKLYEQTYEGFDDMIADLMEEVE